MYSKEKCTIACVVLRRRNGASLFLWHQWEKELKRPKNWEKTLSNLCQLLTTHSVHEGPNHSTETWKKNLFPLLVNSFLPSAFLVLFFLLFLASFRIFPFASAIRRYSVRVLYRHPSKILETIEYSAKGFMSWKFLRILSQCWRAH